MPITSLVLECQLGSGSRVSGRITDLEGAVVVQQRDDRLAVITDTPDAGADHRLVRALGEIPEVVAAVPVFTNHEDVWAQPMEV